MTTLTDQTAWPHFVVTMRGPSAARLWPDDIRGLKLQQYPTPFGPLDLTAITQTIYTDEGFSVPVPRSLGIEVRGAAPSLDEAVGAFLTIRNTLAAFITVATNAAVGDLDVEVAYDITPHQNDHDFFQSFIPSEQGQWPRMSRRVKTDAVGALLQAVLTHPDGDRLLRAIAQYQVALSHWRPGREIPAIAHAYMAVEALTDVAVKAQCIANGLGDDDYAGLAAALGLAETDPAKVPAAVKSAIRVRVLFQNDSTCHRKASQARNGLQHGFMTFDLIRSTARPILERTATYVREAIIDLAGVDSATRAALLTAPYDAPLGAWDPVRYLRGQLHGTVDQLAPAGYQHPSTRWETRIDSITARDEGGYDVTPTDTMTTMTGDKTTFTPSSHEVWGPGKKQSLSGGEQ